MLLGAALVLIKTHCTYEVYCGGRWSNPLRDLCTLKTRGSKVTITSRMRPLCGGTYSLLDAGLSVSVDSGPRMLVI